MHIALLSCVREGWSAELAGREHAEDSLHLPLQMITIDYYVFFCDFSMKCKLNLVTALFP